MTDEFSGGWQMRIELAKLLLREPTILLLDEPTNHLDLESLEWLESYLQSYDGSVIIISHDSRFLDNLVARTLEVSLGRLVEYSGNYAAYLKQKSQRLAAAESAYDNQQRLIKQTMAFVERFRYKATKARQVQSRLRMLDKMEHVAVEREEQEIDFNFPQPAAPGRVVMELKDLGKAYGSVSVLQNVSLKIDRGDRIAMLGVNGSGKSTLARIMAGLELFRDRPAHPRAQCQHLLFCPAPGRGPGRAENGSPDTPGAGACGERHAPALIAGAVSVSRG